MKNFLKSIYFLIVYYPLIFFGFLFASHKEKKAIAGCNETAGVLSTLKKIYGNKIITYSDTPNWAYLHEQYDITIKSSNYYKFFYKPFIFGCLLKNAKCFIYVGGGSFTYSKEKELQIIKRKEIPVIFFFLGSEIRSPILFSEQAKKEKRNTYYDYLPYDIQLFERNARINADLADKYANLIFSQKKDQISYLKTDQKYFPPLFDQKKFHDCMNKFDNIEKVRILHAPSNPNVKGTPIVRAVVQCLLAKGYDFDYIELKGVDNSIIIEELQKSHIVLNQFYLLIPGIFGLEAMANCNAVLMSAEPKELPYKFNDAWFETKDYELYENLKYLLDNKNEILRYARNGFDYMKKNFSEKQQKDDINKYLGEYI